MLLNYSRLTGSRISSRTAKGEFRREQFMDLRGNWDWRTAPVAVQHRRLLAPTYLNLKKHFFDVLEILVRPR